MPEVAGDAACIINPYDILEIRAGLSKIINNPDYRNKLIENGYENAKRFNAKKIADQYHAIYQELSN
jgi:glycosyltransferase involved in cell wall biosynthesis